MANDKRLIDYNEVRELFSEEYKKTAQLIRDGETHLDNLAEGFLEADRVIWKLPAVDAVEVVRCKDCKWFKLYKLACVRPYHNGITGVDDFCSRGERKEE